MTRINVVPASELSDKHLGGEFHEISRVFTLARKRGSAHPKAPVEYTLGKGHVLFFYDKLRFISHRYVSLALELEVRAKRKGKVPNIDWGRIQSVIGEAWVSVPSLFNEYEPTPEALEINRQRILERS